MLLLCNAKKEEKEKKNIISTDERNNYAPDAAEHYMLFVQTNEKTRYLPKMSWKLYSEENTMKFSNNDTTKSVHNTRLIH